MYSPLLLWLVMPKTSMQLMLRLTDLFLQPLLYVLIKLMSVTTYQLINLMQILINLSGFP